MSVFLLAAAAAAAAAAQTQAEIDVWPYPQRVNVTSAACDAFSAVSGQLAITTSITSAVLAAGVARLRERINDDASLSPYRDNVFGGVGGLVWPRVARNASAAAAQAVTVLQIVVQRSENDEPLSVTADASYELLVGTNGSATITAASVWGALHGLETLAQLILWTEHGNVICGVPLAIADWPRFAWRGLLVDSARHFLPIPTLQRIVDGLAMLKMNVLHWHLTDAESFPFQAASHPELSAKGAYHATKAVYTPADVAELTQYAAARGVVVMPEIDVPSHSASWGLGLPAVVADCWPYLQMRAGAGVPLQWPAWDNVALDVSNNATLGVVRDVYADLAAAFGASAHFHLGGDEVNGRCWASVPAIRQWMTANNFSQPANCSQPQPRGFVCDPMPNSTDSGVVFNTGAVQMQFEHQLETFVHDTLNRTAVLWEEAFYPEFANTTTTRLSPSAIVHIWTDASSIIKAIAANRTLISSIDWYLDRVDPLCDGANCTIGYAYVQTWRELYSVDPVELAVGEGASRADAQRLILGGEAASWGESVDAVNAITRAFTRGVAVAERLWSARSVNNSALAVPRLNSWRCKALRAGLAAGSTFPAFCDVSAPAPPTAPPPSTSAAPPTSETACAPLDDTGEAVRIGTIVVGCIGGPDDGIAVAWGLGHGVDYIDWST